MRFTSRTARLPASSTYSTANLSRRMALHVAGALLLFTIIQLWATAAAVQAGAPRWMPFIGLALLLLGAIPTARMMERRWQRWGEGVLPCPKIAARYRRDITLLWVGALFVPLLWATLFAGALSHH